MAGTVEFSITPSNDYGTGAIGTHTATIGDPPPEPVQAFFEVASETLQEDHGTRVLAVRLSEPNPGPGPIQLRVEFDEAASTASVGPDVTWADRNVNFSPGTQERTIQFTVQDDAATEGDETFVLDLSVNVGQAVLGTPSTYTATIAANDEAQDPEVTWTTSSTVAIEGLPAIGLTCEVANGQNPNGLTIPVVQTGSASAADAAITWPGGLENTIVMQPGQLSAVVQVRALDDGIVDPGEVLSFVLQPAAEYDLGAINTLNVSIQDSGGGSSTLVDWETDPAIPPSEEVLVQFVTGVDPVLVADLPSFYVGDVECDVFPVTYTRDVQGSERLCDSVQVVAKLPNNGTALFENTSSNPTTPAVEYSEPDLSGLTVSTVVSSGATWTAIYDDTVLPGGLLRNGRYIREEVTFSRTLGPSGEKGPGCQWFVSRREGLLEVCLWYRNDLYHPDPSTLYASDPDVTGEFYFESIRLSGVPAGWSVVEADAALPTTDWDDPSPWIVTAEADGTLAGNANDVLAGGGKFMARFVIYETATYSAAQARAIGRLAGYATAVAGPYAIHQRSWYASVAARPIDPMNPRRSFGGIEGRQAMIAYEAQDVDTPNGLVAHIESGNSSSGDEFGLSARGYYYPYGRANPSSGSGTNIALREDASWCRSGWRAFGLKAQHSFMRHPSGLLDPDTGLTVRAEDLAAQDPDGLAPWCLSPRCTSASQKQSWVPHWLRPGFATNNPQYTVRQLMDITRPWNAPGQVGGQDVRVKQNLATVRVLDAANGWNAGEMDHHTRQDQWYEPLAFGANIGWAKWWLMDEAHHFMRAMPRVAQRSNAPMPNGWNDDFQTRQYNLDRTVDLLTGSGKEQWGGPEISIGSGSHTWQYQRGYGMCARAIGQGARLMTNMQHFQDVQAWTEAYSRAVEIVCTPWGGGHSFNAATVNPGDDLNYGHNFDLFGPSDIPNRTGGTPYDQFPPINWRICQAWMNGYLGFGIQCLVRSVVLVNSPEWFRFERCTRVHMLAMWREFPSGARVPGEFAPPAYCITAEGANGNDDPPMSLPGRWKFEKLFNDSFAAVLNHRAYNMLAETYRIAQEIGPAPVVDELREYVGYAAGATEPTPTQAELLDILYGRLNLITNPLARSQRYGLLDLIGVVEAYG